MNEEIKRLISVMYRSINTLYEDASYSYNYINTHLPTKFRVEDIQQAISKVMTDEDGVVIDYDINKEDWTIIKVRKVDVATKKEGKYLWKLFFDCGRMGHLEGLFVATKSEVDNLIGRYAHFGEALGKHSEVYGEIGSNEITKMELSPDVVEQVANILGDTWSGYNPMNYARYTCLVCECECRGEEMYDVAKGQEVCLDCYDNPKKKM